MVGRHYDVLILNGYDHYRVFHSRNEFACGKSHVNGIECFWSFCKGTLANLMVVSLKNFQYFLKNLNGGIIIEEKIYSN